MPETSLQSRLEACGIEAVRGVPEGYRVDGPEPHLHVRPADEGAVCRLLALARESGAAVIPRGGGTQDRLGRPLDRASVVLDTRSLDRVVEYNPADLTVTVQAGLRLAALQRLLAEHGQWLPADPPGEHSMTVGGWVAAAAVGPRRLGYGAPRDLVLGLRVALAAGHTIRTGGRVVKNVAGYDLTRLFTGSMGTLGVLTEVSLKVRPLPGARHTAVYTTRDPAGARQLARAVLQSELVPAAVELLSPGMCRLAGVQGPWAVAVLVEESPSAVRYHAERLEVLAREAGARHAHQAEGNEAAAFWRRFGHPWHEAVLAVRVSVPPAAAPDVLARAEGLVRSAGVPSALELLGMAGPGTGLVRLFLVDRAGSAGGQAGPEPPAGPGAPRQQPARDGTAVAALTAWVGALAASAREHGGALVVEAAPAAVKERVDVWGPPGPAHALMRGIKERFDPSRVLNPGRFVGGI